VFSIEVLTQSNLLSYPFIADVGKFLESA